MIPLPCGRTAKPSSESRLRSGSGRQPQGASAPVLHHRREAQRPRPVGPRVAGRWRPRTALENEGHTGEHVEDEESLFSGGADVPIPSRYAGDIRMARSLRRRRPHPSSFRSGRQGGRNRVHRTALAPLIQSAVPTVTTACAEASPPGRRSGGTQGRQRHRGGFAGPSDRHLDTSSGSGRDGAGPRRSLVRRRSHVEMRILLDSSAYSHLKRGHRRVAEIVRASTAAIRSTWVSHERAVEQGRAARLARSHQDCPARRGGDGRMMAFVFQGTLP